MKSHSITYLLRGSEHIYLNFWAFEAKCTQYGICGQETFKNAKTFVNWSGGVAHGCRSRSIFLHFFGWECLGVLDCKPRPWHPLHPPPNPWWGHGSNGMSSSPNRVMAWNYCSCKVKHILRKTLLLFSSLFSGSCSKYRSSTTRVTHSRSTS